LRSREIKAVFIDMDGTLVHMPPDFTPARFLQQVYYKLGFQVELARIERAYEAAEAWWQELFADDYTRWTRENFVEFNRRLLLRLGLGRKGELTSLAERIQDHWERAPEESGERLYPEARAALEELKARGLSLGILSNRSLHTIRSSLRKHGISDYFQFLISPQAANAPKGKLDPAMWAYALKQAGVAPEEAAHIGDRYDHDVVGARAAGVLPILIDREEKHDEVNCLKAADLLEAAFLLIQIPDVSRFDLESKNQMEGENDQEKNHFLKRMQNTR